MNKLEILRVVYRFLRVQGRHLGYTLDQLRTDLGISHGNWLSDAALSTSLRGRDDAAAARLLRLLSSDGPDASVRRARIEQSLGIAGLFDCKTLRDVFRLLGFNEDGSHATDRFVVLTTGSLGDIGLCPVEEKALDLVAQELFQHGPLLHLPVAFNSGSSFIAKQIPSSPRCSKEYAEFIYLRPSLPNLDYEFEFRQLLGHLSAGEEAIYTPQQIVERINSTRRLLVILSPFVIDHLPASSMARTVIEEFVRRAGDWSGPAGLLVVGDSEWLSKKTHRTFAEVGDRFRNVCSLSGDDRLVELRRQWHRFLKDDLTVSANEAGSQLRRATSYYKSDNTVRIWPISVKLRALFAANRNSLAFFDPTQGFRKLAGSDFDKYLDIKEYYADVTDHLELLAGNMTEGIARQSDQSRFFYLLQYMSTAKYWLTDGALETLIDKIPPDRSHSLRIKTEMERTKVFYPIITARFDPITGENNVSGEGHRYYVSLPVKAIVQDLWKDRDPYSRALAHYRVAKRLKDNENQKDLLDREFPYHPQWGRSRIFFLAETVRHLIRSCEAVPLLEEGPSTTSSLTFPSPPKPGSPGTNPMEVVNYCYAILYQQELNGNSGGFFRRNLSNTFGAYQLSAELLSLMSDSQVIGTPHRYLAKEKHPEFVRECAYALLDMGEPIQARDCLSKLVASDKDGSPTPWSITVLLDMSLLSAVLGDHDGADGRLTLAEAHIGRLHSALVDQKVNLSEHLVLRRLFRRLISQRAYLAFLNGAYEEVLKNIAMIESEEQWQHLKGKDGNYSVEKLVPTFGMCLEPDQDMCLEPDQELLVAAAEVSRAESLTEDSDVRKYAKPLERIIKALLRAQSDGVHHQAMAFRIALGRVFRKMGFVDVAETTLDEVHRDVLTFGCSERTFLFFLNEAGRVLLAKGDFIRAYATYLRPCMYRAIGRHLKWDAMMAARAARHSLNALKSLLDDGAIAKGSASLVRLVEEALKRQQSLTSRASAAFTGSRTERDPLFAYAVADAEEIIRSLGTAEGLEAEMKRVEVIESAMSYRRPR